MQDHVRVLAALLVAYGALGAAIGVGVLVFFGGLAAAAGLAAEPEDSLVAVPLLVAIGTFTATVLLALSVPRVIGGIALLKGWSWARVFSLIVVAIGVFDFPVGTAIGIYGFWVLTRGEADVAR